ASPGKRLKATAKVAKSRKKNLPAQGLETLSEIALSEADQMKLITKRSKTDYHISHASGSGANEGTGVKPRVPDVPSYGSKDDQISWKSNEEDDDDEVNEEDKEEEWSDDGAYDEVTQGGNVEKENMDEEKSNEGDEIDLLYSDVNINLERTDTEMTDAPQTNVQATQVIEDTHEGHFAKDYRSKQGNIARSAVYQELDLDDNSDIVLADFDDSSVYSISEGEGDTHQSISVMVQDTPIEEAVFMAIEEDDESDNEQEEEDNQFSHYAFMFHHGPLTKIAEMVQAVGSWKPNKELSAKSKECEHEWKENTVTNYTIFYYYRILTTDMSRLNCPKCQLTSALCAMNYLGKTVNVKGKQPQKSEEEKDFNNNEVKLLKEILKEKTKQVQQMIRDQAKEYYKNKDAIQKKEEIWQSKESLLVRDLTDALKIIDQLRIEKERLEEQKDEEIRELKTQLQKKKEEAEV
ncbi:hypothetical protein Tco_1408169, partial [Tanacetum coccineum]